MSKQCLLHCKSNVDIIRDDDLLILARTLHLDLGIKILLICTSKITFKLMTVRDIYKQEIKGNQLLPMCKTTMPTTCYHRTKFL